MFSFSFFDFQFRARARIPPGHDFMFWGVCGLGVGEGGAGLNEKRKEKGDTKLFEKRCPNQYTILLTDSIKKQTKIETNKLEMFSVGSLGAGSALGRRNGAEWTNMEPT